MYPHWRVKIHRLRGVRIGKDVFIGSDVFIDNTYPQSIIIEDAVTIISRCFIIGHSFTPVHMKKIIRKEMNNKSGVILKKGCYIGAQCIILPGVTVGECTIIGAGSVVTKSIPSYSIAIGVPARITRTFDVDDINRNYL
jgi:acetyltransferase-like isoleucine patch superfamily enzyme